MYKNYQKRLLDVVISIVLIIIFFPVMLLIFLILLISIGSPIFSQLRPGYNKELFRIYKFKTMTDNLDKDGNLLKDKYRITKFGKFLRSSSLDELPTLWVVLIGNMSIVGPRPLLKEYLPLYSKEQSKRHLIKPGITGWAQINGRNNISWNKKFELDIWYLENQSLLLDLKIILLTIKKVLLREGISAKGEATMPFFKNSKK